eukprot:15431377-Alexandrium_andersonii.AAC.1
MLKPSPSDKGTQEAPTTQNAETQDTTRQASSSPQTDRTRQASSSSQTAPPRVEDMRARLLEKETGAQQRQLQQKW